MSLFWISLLWDLLCVTPKVLVAEFWNLMGWYIEAMKSFSCGALGAAYGAPALICLFSRSTRFFIFSQFDWICRDGTEGVCVYVCMCVCVYVCVCVCVWQRYSPNGWMDFDEIFHKWSDRYLWGLFFSDFEISKRWRHGGHFCTFLLGHSHGRNFAPVFFKI